jgi:hypothetical protein
MTQYLEHLYCDDPPCPDCETATPPLLLRCSLCNVAGRVVLCGHYDLPRPLAPSEGADFPDTTCGRCEYQQEVVCDLIEALLGRDAPGEELTRFRRAVNAVLHARHPCLPRGLTEHQAVSCVWNDGQWRAIAAELLSRS